MTARATLSLKKKCSDLDISDYGSRLSTQIIRVDGYELFKDGKLESCVKLMLKGCMNDPERKRQRREETQAVN